MKRTICLIAIIGVFTSFTDKAKTWVAIGDSITYLNDHLNETGNRVTRGYLSMVTGSLHNIQYINQGRNGWAVVSFAKEIEKLGLQKADIYSVFLGTNDWWKGVPLGTLNDYRNATGIGTVYGGYRVIINKIRELNAQAPVILITPMQRVDFVQYGNMKNNAWGSYKDKNGQFLSQFAAAVDSIGMYEHFKVIDLYHKKGMELKDMVKYKRLKDPATGQYKNYPYPESVDVPFNPETDEYPYPDEAIDITYDGLHPSDAGNRMIADMLIRVMKRL
jgi:lysophospholipase L1-like esterase